MSMLIGALVATMIWGAIALWASSGVAYWGRLIALAAILIPAGALLGWMIGLPL